MLSQLLRFNTVKEWGLYKIKGDKVSVINNHLEAVEVILNEVDSLPEEAPLDILKGLSIF